MSKQYWLHRISHEWTVAYSLLEEGYLSIGWKSMAQPELLQAVHESGYHGFLNWMKHCNEYSRSRWNLWNFFSFSPGDYVVVPMFNKEFSIVKIEEPAILAASLAGKEFLSQTGERIKIDKEGICNQQTGDYYDIGFLIKIEPIRLHIPRNFADAQLVSRMKLRQANANISDLANAVETVLKVEKAISTHEVLVEVISASIKEMFTHITPDHFERIVRWYMQKKGASRVWIPAKNESGKYNGADADVIAEFDDLGVIFYIQVKKHDGITSDWAVHQIYEYANQKQDEANDYTYIPWVVTTANFDEKTVQDAKTKGVRLIDGNAFARMLSECDISDIDAAF